MSTTDLTTASNASPSTAGDRLRAWRERSGYSQSQLALALGVRDYQMISKLERSVKTPSLNTATAIERLTGIPAGSWLPLTAPGVRPTGRAGRRPTAANAVPVPVLVPLPGRSSE